jgi:hypothetical protein
MSDTDTPTPPAAPAAPRTPPKTDPPANTVPYDRFTEVNEKSKRLSAELEELRQWKDEQESKSLSELERERKRAEAAEKRAQEAEQRVTNLERGSWVRAAAAEAGFSTRPTRSSSSTSPTRRPRRRPATPSSASPSPRSTCSSRRMRSPA